MPNAWGLTPQQERFAQAVAEGMNYSTAYRVAYDHHGGTNKTIWDSASKVASDPGVAQRIAALTEDAGERLTSGIAWTTEKVIQEAGVNLMGARADGNWPAANGALAIGAGASGVVTSAARVEHSGGMDVVHRLDSASNEMLDRLIGLAPEALPPSTEPDEPPGETVEGSSRLLENETDE